MLERRESLHGMAVLSGTIILLLLHGSIAFSQNDSLRAKRVSDYLSLIENSQTSTLASIPSGQLKQYARIVYEADETDPLAVDKEIQKNRKWRVSPSRFRYALLNSIKARLSLLDFNLVAAPRIVKATIIRVETVDYKVEGGPPGVNAGSLPRTDLTAIVDEVFKSDTLLSTGDIIRFYYFPFWRPTRWNFEIGDTCLLPLEPLLFRGTEFVALITDLDGHRSDTGAIENDSASYGRYPIVNGVLVDRKNSFGYGARTKWESFRSILLQEIKAIKSW